MNTHGLRGAVRLPSALVGDGRGFTAAQASTSPVSPAPCLAATPAPVELTPADQLLPACPIRSREDRGLRRTSRLLITRALPDDKGRRRWCLRP